MAAVLHDVPALHPLRDLVEDDFSRNAVEAAARAYADRDNPLRLNFFCAAMRILFEHSMDRLSPLGQVELCAWFRPEQESGKPTRAQRVKYAVQGGLSDAFVAKRLGLDLRPVQRTFTRTIDSLSKHIHAREHTVVRDIVEQDELAQEVIDAAVAYFEAAGEARVAVMAPIQEQLDETAVDALLQETILAIDELASHHSIEEVYVDRLAVYLIDAVSIVYRAHGQSRQGSSGARTRMLGAATAPSSIRTSRSSATSPSRSNIRGASTELRPNTASTRANGRMQCSPTSKTNGAP